jgi:hypothetical protein
MVTAFDEYHPRQLTIVQYYYLQSLYFHTEETPASQRTIYTITYIEHTQYSPSIVSKCFITCLILIILTYRNLSHNILNNCNTKYSNQQVY